LKEEMGFETELQEIFSFTYKASFENGLIENEFDHVLLGFSDEKPGIDPNEVEEWKHIDADRVFRESVDEPDIFTPWFRLALPRVIKHISELSGK